MVRSLSLLLLSISIRQLSFSQQFNTDAIQQFWVIVDQLKQDKPLTDSLWNNYYNLYGNKNYMEHNRPKEQVAEHRKYLEYVFRPSLRDSLTRFQAVAASNPDDDILKNLLYIKSREKELRTYTHEITAADYLSACMALAKKYLPGKTNAVPKELTIYINAMTFDAAVQSPDMYFGLSIIYEFDRFRRGAIAAHEMHHQLRVNKEIEHPISYADSTSFSIVSQINNEGTADLVDKTVALKYKDSMFDAKDLLRWLFDSATEVIRSLDARFLVNANVNAHPLTYRDFRKITLYSSGHIPGFFMANIISRNGKMQELINHCDNPFYIFYLYNEAAEKDAAHPVRFSAATIRYLRALEKKVY